MLIYLDHFGHIFSMMPCTSDLRTGKVYDLASGEGTEGRKLYQLEEEENLS